MGGAVSKFDHQLPQIKERSADFPVGTQGDDLWVTAQDTVERGKEAARRGQYRGDVTHFANDGLKFVKCHSIFLKKLGGVVGNTGRFSLSKVHSAVLPIEDVAE